MEWTRKDGVGKSLTDMKTTGLAGRAATRVGQEGAGWIGEGADVRLNYVRLHITLWNKISWRLSV